jgi:hypothetical protein
MKKHDLTFETTENLVMENSFGITDAQNNVKLEINIGWIDDETGYFEISDIETGGNNWYTDGQLFLQNNVLIDYDGVFELLPCILDALEKMGIDVSDHRFTIE